jgi:hypothetical protein
MTARASVMVGALILTGLALLPETVKNGGIVVSAQESQAGVPEYKVDPNWPKPLPNNWLLGGVSGITVDDRDHVWILHRPKVLTDKDPQPGQGPPSTANCCVPAPSVIEFDPEGKVVQAWGGNSTDQYHWPYSEHGIDVDRQGNVWVTDEGNSRRPNDGGFIVLKFTRTGQFVMQIGKYGVRGENADTETLGQVAQANVDDAANEVFVAEGHQSRRLMVFDATTGKYKRRWNAYGLPTTGGPSAPFDATAPPSKEFGEVHCAQFAKDGLVYLCDRKYNRIQVFKKDGTFVEEIVFIKDGKGYIAPWDVAMSVDRDQKFLFVADGGHMKVWVVQRKPLKVVGSFGGPGRAAGQFLFINALAVDSKGNIYTGEVTTGDRVQKFVPVKASGTK